MNRRKAIGTVLLGAVAGGSALSGYKWYDWHKTPDIHYLEQQRNTIAALAETIIPSSVDGPGAREAGVHDFIMIMIKDCTDSMSANKFIDGLKDLNNHCRSKYNRPFEDCTAAEQETIVQHFEEKGRPFKGILGKVQNKYLGRSFFSTLKLYTAEGYCTSQQGATRGLAYALVPGAYHGCIPKLPGQKAWATK